MSNTTVPLPPGSYDSRVSTTVGVTIVSLSIASIVVVLRTYTRRWIIHQMGVDDYFAIASLLMAYGTGIAILTMTNFGLGHHIWILQNPQVQIPLYLRSFYVSIVLYCAGLFTIKLTFLTQYYRVFGVANLRRVFIAAIVIVGAWSLSQLLIGIFICSPIRGFWDHTIPSTCVPNYPQFYINAAGNIATDLAVLVMPFPLLKRLNLPRQQKLLLFGIFGLGFFTVAISVLRFKWLTMSEDYTWQNVETSAWSIGELCSGITCACLPTLRPFLKAHFPGLGTQLTGGGGDGTYYGANDLETAVAGAAATHKRAGSESSQPSVQEREQAAGPAYMRRVGGGESGESTEDMLGSGAGRERIGERSRGDVSDEEREAHLGLRMTVLSRVDAGVTPPLSLAESGGGIQVRTTLSQVGRQRSS